LTKLTDLRIFPLFWVAQGLLLTELSTLSVDKGPWIFALENPQMAR